MVNGVSNLIKFVYHVPDNPKTQTQRPALHVAGLLGLATVSTAVWGAFLTFGQTDLFKDAEACDTALFMTAFICSVIPLLIITLMMIAGARRLCCMARSKANTDTRRLLGLCVSFFVLFTSFFAAQNQVAPTLGKFGSLSLGLLYGTFAAAAVLAPGGLRFLRRLCANGPYHDRDSLRAEVIALAASSFLYAPFPLACSENGLRWEQLVGSVLLGGGAGLLWVSQGALLTACTAETNRGRWSGIFWASFMAGNAVGNFASSAIVRRASVSTMFITLSAVAAASSLCFLVLVPPRAAALRTMPEGLTRQREPATTLLGDLATLVGVLQRRETLCLLPALMFIGAENAFWGGEFATLVSDLGGADAVGVAIGCLALSDMASSVIAGWLVDRAHAGLALFGGLVTFCGGLTVIVFQLLPLLPPSEHHVVSEGVALPAPVWLAAVLMGAGDGAVNTVLIARLGSLADEASVLPREAAFQYFQVANVAMTAIGFVYAPLTPLEPKGGALQYQPIFLAFLALCGGLCYRIGSPSPPGTRLKVSQALVGAR